MTKSRFGTFRCEALAVALALSMASMGAGCGASLDDAKDALDDLPDDVDTGDVEAEALKILHALFPDLSDEEVVEIRGSLSFDELLALRDELEAIRKEAAAFSEALFKTAEERAEERAEELSTKNDGFPEGLEPVGRVCTYDTQNGRAEVNLSGVFEGHAEVQLTSEQVHVTVDGVEQTASLLCIQGGDPVDIVFLIDITGSMSNVIHAVRDSVVSFIDALEASGIKGTVGVVTFQDSVGVNRTFQEPSPELGYERSPFFAPVPLDDASQVEAVRKFVNRLEANAGADAPENLSGAIDFARNNVIGTMANGAPNVIGDGREDPAGTEPFPKLKSARQVFVALTDITFHGDDRDDSNSSLLSPFVPRDAGVILRTLQQTGTTVHVSDPSWVDESLSPGDSQVDADYWAIHTGGIGEDRVAGYSLVDLELVITAEESGLLDINLDKIVATSCSLSFDTTLSASAQVELSLEVGSQTFSELLTVERF